MKKRERIFLEALVPSLILIMICTTMVHCTYPNAFEMRPSEKIYLEQGGENQELRDWGGQELLFTNFARGFGSIRNTIGVNAKTSCLPTWILPNNPHSITAQILLQPFSRASPP